MARHVKIEVSRAAYVADVEVAAHFGVNRATIWGWVNRNGFPAPVKLSPQMTRWKWEEVEAWEAAQRAPKRFVESTK